MDPFARAAVAAAYDAVAEDYAIAFGDDLLQLPVDRFLLEAAARRIGDGVAIDVGSGPGQISRYLADRGHAMIALDFACRMLTLGGRNGRIGGVCADMRQLITPHATGLVDHLKPGKIGRYRAPTAGVAEGWRPAAKASRNSLICSPAGDRGERLRAVMYALGPGLPQVPA